MAKIIYYWNKFIIMFFIKKINSECHFANKTYFNNFKLIEMNNKKFKMKNYILYR
jgi:hypothetical protein